MEGLRRSDAQELGDLLELAEKVQASYESSARRESLWRLIEAVLLISGTLAAVFGAIAATVPVLWLVGGSTLLIYAFVVDHGLIRRIRRRSASDRNALREVLSLLHELEGIAAAEDNWTPLQRAEFRIRLSRFEIEEAPTGLDSLRRSIVQSFR